MHIANSHIHHPPRLLAPPLPIPLLRIRRHHKLHRLAQRWLCIHPRGRQCRLCLSRNRLWCSSLRRDPQSREERAESYHVSHRHGVGDSMAVCRKLHGRHHRRDHCHRDGERLALDRDLLPRYRLTRWRHNSNGTLRLLLFRVRGRQW